MSHLDWLSLAGVPAHVRPGKLVWTCAHSAVVLIDNRPWAWIAAHTVAQVQVTITGQQVHVGVALDGNFECKSQVEELFATEAEAREALAQAREALAQERAKYAARVPVSQAQP